MQFRFKALQKMREPDELDTVILLARPRGWILSIVVLIVVAGAGVWACAGQIPRTVTADGLVTHPLGVTQLQTAYGGQVSQLSVSPGDHVTKGQVVLNVTGQANTLQPVTSPFTGTVISVEAAVGQVVAVGSTVLTVERTDGPNDRLVAMVFAPASQTAGLRPGDPADLAVSSAPSAAFGLMLGQVASVGQYPLTRQALGNLLGGDVAAGNFASVPDPELVVVNLTRDPKTVSGYAWTSVNGPPSPLTSQVSVTATITVSNEHPINLVLGR
jgi:multidrug efflux pump subunit AcrA (membrane-fusion protein)